MPRDVADSCDRSKCTCESHAGGAEQYAKISEERERAAHDAVEKAKQQVREQEAYFEKLAREQEQEGGQGEPDGDGNETDSETNNGAKVSKTDDNKNNNPAGPAVT